MSNEAAGTQTYQSLLDSITVASQLSLNERSVPGDLTKAAEIPRATYRLQFNKSFTFNDALKLLPYLNSLGISHVYASPILEARPGSMHGYDLINHSRINPEIGTLREFVRFCRAIKRCGMRLIVDIVPNHMGVGKSNPWWMDVLENGPASEYAEYFDIDWRPVKQELAGKVVIPVLGDSYGSVLTSGHLKLVFHEDKGSLAFQYYEHELPLNPVSYPDVLGLRLDELAKRLGETGTELAEYQSILSAFSHLPGHMEPSGFNRRITEKSLQMRRLAELCARNSEIGNFIRENLDSFHGSQQTDNAAFERMHRLLEAQAFRLVFWRVANDEINYRRFFDVNDLAALRTEDARVFADMHRFIFRLIEQGFVDGLRIDHPDGLYDPAQYFNDLQKGAAEKLGTQFLDKNSGLPFYVIVEKILASFEKLEDNWAVHGTTGYDFLNELLGVLICGEHDERFHRIYCDFVDGECSYEEMRIESKHTILSMVLASELNMLAHQLSNIAESSWYYRDITLNAIRNALREILVQFPVYRTYCRPGVVDKSAVQFIDWAISKAKRNDTVARTSVYEFIRSVLLMEAQQSPTPTGKESELEFKKAVENFAMKFQQFSGPVMAKSVEDTLFYRYARFIALNEVGGEPEKFSSSVAAFHKRNQQRSQRYPNSMLASSTHDTKRSEDVRARLAVLSEIPIDWERRVNLWARMNRLRKVETSSGMVPDPHTEYFFYQTLAGSFPLELKGEEALASYRQRIVDYMLKAVKEAKLFTSWINQNAEYEQRIADFVNDVLTPGPNNAFLPDLQKFVNGISSFGLHNSMLQTILKLTCPGVPDLYQGSELWDFSLVDPDNRRPVNFAERQSMLADFRPRSESNVDGASSEASASRQLCDAKSDASVLLVDLLLAPLSGRIKLYVISRLLQLREKAPELFERGTYIPLAVNGTKANHLIAFARKEESGRSLIVILPRFLAGLRESLLALRSRQDAGTLGSEHSEVLEEQSPTDSELSQSSAKPGESNTLENLRFDELADPEIWGDTQIVLPPEFSGLLNWHDLLAGKNIEIADFEYGTKASISPSTDKEFEGLLLNPAKCFELAPYMVLLGG